MYNILYESDQNLILFVVCGISLRGLLNKGEILNILLGMARRMSYLFSSRSKYDAL